MSNLNVQQEYVLSLLKEISGLRDQNDNLKLEVTAVRQNSEEDAKHFWQLKADFKTACDKANEWKAEALKAFAQNREFAKENQALVSQLEIKMETVGNV